MMTGARQETAGQRDDGRGLAANAPLIVALGFGLLLLAGSGFLLPDTIAAFAKGLGPFWSLVCQ
jgi:hypothetical protein